MKGSIKKNIGISSAIVLVIFVIISFSVSCFMVRLTGLKYQDSIASEALDMAEFTINVDLAKDSFNTRSISEEYTSVLNQLISYQRRNSASIKRISLVSFSNTSGGYIYDTGGAILGLKLDYNDYTSSIRTELINGRNPLKHSENGIISYYRPLRTVDDNLCGYLIVELNQPFEYRYIPVAICIFAGMLLVCGIFVFILINALNRKMFYPIRKITSSAIYLAGDDTASDGMDAKVFFDTNRNDEIGSLSKALQKILFDKQSRKKNLSQALFDANHDGMTQMLNKRCYHSMEDIFRNSDNICLIYFDVNNLKLMNDTLGHENGDYVIISAAEYIKSFIGAEDHCFRMGGDEFLMVMINCSFRTINSIVEKLEGDSPKILSKPEDSIKCAISYGYAYSTGEKRSYDELLAEAEKNMYEKKAALKQQLQMPDR